MLKKHINILIVVSSVVLLSIMGGYIYYVFYYDNPQVISSNEVDNPIEPVVKNDDKQNQITTTQPAQTTKPIDIQSTKKESFKRPIKDGDVVKPYFNEKADVKDIQNALTHFENVYYPNNGVNYANNGKDFSVLAITSGTIVDISDNSTYGKSIVVSNNGYEITYQSLKDTMLNKGDTIKQGDIIGNAGTNKYDADLGINVRVLVTKNGIYLNLEDLLNKSV